MYPSRHVQNNAPAADSAYWCVLWAGRGWTLISFFSRRRFACNQICGCTSVSELLRKYFEMKQLLPRIWASECESEGGGFGGGGGAKLVSGFRFSWTCACCLHWLHWKFGIMTNSPKVDCVSRILKPLIHPESFVGESSWTCLCVSGCCLCPATDWLM